MGSNNEGYALQRSMDYTDYCFSVADKFNAHYFFLGRNISPLGLN